MHERENAEYRAAEHRLQQGGYDRTWLLRMARTVIEEVLRERVDFIEHPICVYGERSEWARRAMMQHRADFLDKLRNGADIVPIRIGTV